MMYTWEFDQWPEFDQTTNITLAWKEASLARLLNRPIRTMFTPGFARGLLSYIPIAWVDADQPDCVVQQC